MKKSFRDNNKERISNIARVYDSLAEAQRYFRRTPPSGLWDWVRDRQLSIANSYINSSFFTVNGKTTALDIGCNSGRYTKALQEKGIEAVGIDTASIPLSCASSWVPQASFVRASVLSLPFERKTFNYVICIELLHHFTDEVIKEALREITRVIKPGGILIFDLKNRWNPVMRYIYRRDDKIRFTLKTRSVSRMISLVEANGFKVIKKRGIPPIPFLAPFVVLCAVKGGK